MGHASKIDKKNTIELLWCLNVLEDIVYNH